MDAYFSVPLPLTVTLSALQLYVFTTAPERISTVEPLQYGIILTVVTSPEMLIVLLGALVEMKSARTSFVIETEVLRALLSMRMPLRLLPPETTTLLLTP